MKLINFIGKLIAATVVAIIFGIVEMICAIPCGLKDYYNDCVVPAYKDIWEEYKK